MAILTSYKIDFGAGKIFRDKEKMYYLGNIKGKFMKKTVILYAQNLHSGELYEAKSAKIEGTNLKIHKLEISTHFPQQLRANYIENQQGYCKITMKQNVVKIYKTLHSTTAEYILYSSAKEHIARQMIFWSMKETLAN